MSIVNPKIQQLSVDQVTITLNLTCKIENLPAEKLRTLKKIDIKSFANAKQETKNYKLLEFEEILPSGYLALMSEDDDSVVSVAPMFGKDSVELAKILLGSRGTFGSQRFNFVKTERKVRKYSCFLLFSNIFQQISQK